MKIEVLKELTNLLNARLLKKQKTVKHLKDDSELLTKLFLGLKEDKVSNEEEAKKPRLCYMKMMKKALSSGT